MSQTKIHAASLFSSDSLQKRKSQLQLQVGQGKKTNWKQFLFLVYHQKTKLECFQKQIFLSYKQDKKKDCVLQTNVHNYLISARKQKIFVVNLHYSIAFCLSYNTLKFHLYALKKFILSVK